MPTAISWRSKAWLFALAFRRTRGLGQCLPLRKGEPTGSLHSARVLGWGAVGDCPHFFPDTPPASPNAATSWRKMASDCPFFQGAVSASSGYGAWWQAHVCPRDRWPWRCCPLGTRGTEQACLLPRLLPQSGVCAPALAVPSCLPQARLPSPRTGSG